ncbi:MAG: hypothetical protein R2795_17860 [Saprospiraceae bacterium]
MANIRSRVTNRIAQDTREQQEKEQHQPYQNKGIGLILIVEHEHIVAPILATGSLIPYNPDDSTDGHQDFIKSSKGVETVAFIF